MVSERAQRRIERLLDEADQAADCEDWEAVRASAGNILAFDPDNPDALAYLAAAQRKLRETGNEEIRKSGSQGMAATALTSSVPHVPTSFAHGRYTVQRFLGEGGKKRVYLAHDTMLARDVAFALIKTDGLDAEGRERITREAQAMGRLGAHPHIVAVFDIGVETNESVSRRTGEPASGSAGILPAGAGQGGGTPYLVTELMGGGDIQALLEKAEAHRLPIDDAVNLALQVCQGLEFAHSKGLIHRDLKPGNVWLTAPYQSAQSQESVQSVVPSRGGDGAVAKIGDFGLAVSLDRSRLTVAGMMVGTVC